MRLCYGVPEDIEKWMSLVERVRWNFPGLETQEKLDEYKATVVRFMGKRQAVCVKADGEIVGVILFSRGHNMICCLGVSPDHRRRGIASMLMEEALRNLDRTREISVSTFRADDEKGLAPRALYEKYGFVAGALVEAFGYPNQEYILYPAGSERCERQKSVNKMVHEIGSILSDCEPSIYLYGSSALDDFRLGWSDVDILVLTVRQISEEQAQKLVKLRQTMLETEPDNLYYRLFEGGMLTLDAFISKSPDRVIYWGTSGERITDTYMFDSFSMAELIESGILLYGRDVRSRLKAPGFGDLYADVQRHYETIRKYARKTERSLYSFGWLLDIARCLYTLRTGKIIAKTAAADWVMENNLCPVVDALKVAVKVRRAPLEHMEGEYSMEGEHSMEGGHSMEEEHSRDDNRTLDLAETLGEPIQRFADVLEEDLKRNSNMTVKTIEIHGANARKTFSKTRVGCRGVVIKDSCMLISHEVNTDYYLIPGGGLEGNETLEECCVREVREETGYIVKPACHFLTINEYYGEYKFIDHYFLCDIIGESEQNLTAAEIERGLIPEWLNPYKMLELYSKHNDFASTNEDKRGAYQREYTALAEYLEKYKP